MQVGSVFLVALYTESGGWMPTASRDRTGPTQTKGKATKKNRGPMTVTVRQSVPGPCRLPVEGPHHLQVPSLRWPRFQEPTQHQLSCQDARVIWQSPVPGVPLRPRTSTQGSLVSAGDGQEPAKWPIEAEVRRGRARSLQ